MKSLINFAFIFFIISVSFTGCYTIVWNPSEEFPDGQSYSQNSEFYDSEYYGSYGSFYETPWWIITPVYITPDNNSLDKSQIKYRTNNGVTNEVRSTNTENMRNSGGRGNTDRNVDLNSTPPTTSSGNTSGTIIKTPPPTRDSNSGNTDSVNKTSNTTGSSRSSSDSGRSSSGSETRNSSGSRNSSSGRK